MPRARLEDSEFRKDMKQQKHLIEDKSQGVRSFDEIQCFFTSQNIGL